MDYDKIVEGRRRNWESLKPEEEVRREKEEKRAQKKAEREERIKKGEVPTTYDRIRDIRIEEAGKLDKENYRRMVKQSAILGGGFLILFLCVFGIERFLAYRKQVHYEQALKSNEVTFLEGGDINDLSTPTAALATWRSAWAKGDISRVVDLYSKSYLYRKAARGDRDLLKREYTAMYQKGSLSSLQELAVRFDGATVLRIPSRPYSQGELALFKSEPIRRSGERKRVSYVAAFSYDKKSQEWRLADIRPQEFFSVAWEIERDIQKIVGGSAAVRYDEDGRVMRDQTDDESGF